MSGFRAAPVSVAFDGESLNNEPAAPNDYPSQLMADYPSIPFRNVARSGATMANLIETAPGRLHPHATTALSSVLVVCQGTNDILAVVSGADLYAYHVTAADNARAAGFGHIIATTLVGNGSNSPLLEGHRTAFNSFLLADADDAFDQIVDLNATDLADWTDTGLYNVDQVHWNAAGAALAAATVKPALDVALA